MENNQMEDKYFTRCIFKMTPSHMGEKEVVAFLVDVPANPYSIMSYMHVGQHGEATREFFYDCKLATPDEYADLKSELQSIGYRLIIRKRLPHR
jgi:hypothetical protein